MKETRYVLSEFNLPDSTETVKYQKVMENKNPSLRLKEIMAALRQAGSNGLTVDEIQECLKQTRLFNSMGDTLH